jgi:hypothetical protein
MPPRTLVYSYSKEYTTANSKKYYAEHTEQVKQYQAKYREQNREKARLYGIAYREAKKNGAKIQCHKDTTNTKDILPPT